LVDLGVKKFRVQRVRPYIRIQDFWCFDGNLQLHRERPDGKTLTKILNRDLETGHDAQAIVTTFNEHVLSHDFKGTFSGKLAEVEEENHVQKQVQKPVPPVIKSDISP
jgi:hypothetical protein